MGSNHDERRTDEVEPQSPRVTSAAPKVATATLALTLTIAFLGWMFDGMEMGLYSIAIRPALDDLMGTTDPARVAPIQGFTLTMFLTGMAAGGIVFGWLGDRIGRVRTMVVTILVYAVFTGLSGLSQHWWHLAACRFLGSMGLGGEWGLGVALVMETWPNASRPLLAGILGAAANFGFLASSGVGALQAHFGWSWRMVLVAGVIPALLTMFIRMAVKEPEKWVRAKERGEKPRWSELFGPSLRRYTLVGCGLGAVAVLGMWGSYQSWVQSWVSDLVRAGLHPPGTDEAALKALQTEAIKDAIWTTTFWMSIGAIVGAVLGGLIGEWFGRRLSYALLCVTAWLAALALYLTCDSYGPRLLFLTAVFGVPATAFFGWLPLYLPELFPTRLRSSGEGFCFNVGRVISAIGAYFTGHLVKLFRSDQVGPDPAATAKAAAVMATIFLVGIIVLFFAPETKGRELPE